MYIILRRHLEASLEVCNIYFPHIFRASWKVCGILQNEFKRGKMCKTVVYHSYWKLKILKLTKRLGDMWMTALQLNKTNKKKNS